MLQFRVYSDVKKSKPTYVYIYYILLLHSSVMIIARAAPGNTIDSPPLVALRHSTPKSDLALRHILLFNTAHNCRLSTLVNQTINVFRLIKYLHLILMQFLHLNGNINLLAGLIETISKINVCHR